MWAVLRPGKNRHKEVNMIQSGNTIPSAIVMTLLGGATLGGFAITFTATKTGKEWKNSLFALAGRFNPNAGRSDPKDDDPVLAAFI
jgi:hypothetical protein